MGKKAKFRDQLRRAIRQSGLSGYRIARETGIQQAQISRFMNGERGLAIDGIEAICELIGLRLVAVGKPKLKPRATKKK